jgi:hypothetical protein
MKKVIRFFKYEKRFHTVLAVVFALSMSLYLIFGLPMLWMKYNAYKQTVGYQIANYSIIPVAITLMAGTMFGGIIFHYARIVSHDHSNRKMFTWFSIFFGIFPGCAVNKLVFFPLMGINYYGLWNIPLGMFTGFIVTFYTAHLVRKPFDYIRTA